MALHDCAVIGLQIQGKEKNGWQQKKKSNKRSSVGQNMPPYQKSHYI